MASALLRHTALPFLYLMLVGLFLTDWLNSFQVSGSHQLFSQWCAGLPHEHTIVCVGPSLPWPHSHAAMSAEPDPPWSRVEGEGLL